MRSIPSQSLSLAVAAAISCMTQPAASQEPATAKPSQTDSAQPQTAKTSEPSHGEPRTALTLTNMMPGPEVKLSPGLTLSHDIAGWVRVGGGAGWMGAGTGTWSWQHGFVGVRALDLGKGEGLHLRVFPSVGLLHFSAEDKEDDGPGRSSRNTTSATTTLGLDATWFGGSGTGFTLRGEVGALWVLSQSTTGGPGSTLEDGYSAGALASLSLGYAF